MFNKLKYLLFIIILFPSTVFAVSLDKTKIDLYYVSDSYQDLITKPSEYLDEDQITVSGASNVTYSISDGENVVVSNTGKVSISKKKEGKSIIKVIADNKTYQVEVNVYSYEKYYAEKKIQDYVDNNITSSMTEYQKMQKILEFLSTTVYSVKYQSYVSMMVTNSGDCWATADSIVYMSRLVGIDAWVRYAVNDPNAGAGHRNVAAYLDGSLYVVEASYENQELRKGKIISTINGFFRGESKYSTVIYQYDGNDKIAEIPASSNIYSIKDYALYYGLHEGSQIEVIRIPSSVQSIGKSAFANVSTLKSIEIDPDNPKYKSVDGIFFNKEGTILYTYPAGKDNTSYVIPNTVTEISDNAFAGSGNLTSVTISDSVKTIGTYAFYYTGIKNLVVPATVEKIGNQIITGHDALVLLNPNLEMGDRLCDSSKPLFGLKGSTAEEYASKNNCPFGVVDPNAGSYKNIKDLDITYDTSVYYNGDNTTTNITIKDGKYVLKEGTDYTLSYFNNSNTTSNARIEITGMGKYIGYVKKYFEIKAKEIKYRYVNPVVDYNGQVQSPIIEILEDAQNLTIKYGNSSTSGLSTNLKEYTMPGTYTFGFVISGKNYKSVYQDDYTFTIKGIDISSAKISDLPDYAYVSGIYFRGNLTVTFNGKELKEGVDYRRSYSGNPSAIGTVTETVTGISPYEGTIKKSYRVVGNDEYELKLSHNKIDIPLNSKFKLDLTTNPKFELVKSKIIWSSSNKSIATVDSEGNVTGVSLGKTTVKARYNGRYVETEVNVVDFLKGDMNHNGKIDLKDIILLIKKYLGTIDINDNDISIGDMNNNSKIDLKDIILLIKTYLGVS